MTLTEWNELYRRTYDAYDYASYYAYYWNSGYAYYHAWYYA